MKDAILRRKQVILFIIAGGLSALVEIGSMKFFSHYIPKFYPKEIFWHGLQYPISNILSTTLAIFFNYWLSIWFVFEQGKHSRRREFTYFMFISFLSTLLSLGLFQFFINFVFISNIDLRIYTLSPIIMSKIAAILTVSIINYSVKKRVIFNG